MNIPEEKVFSNLDNVVDELESIDLGDGNKLEDILKDLECPFTWNLDEMETSRNMIHYLDSFLSLIPDDMVEEGIEEIFTTSCFIKNITLSYFLTMNGQNVQATEIIDNLKKTCCIRFEETESEKLIPAIRHVLSATEIFIFLRSNKTIREKQNFVEDARLNMKSFSNMTNEEKACIHGMKSSVFGFFGLGGNLKALNEAKAALGLDSQEAEWWFISGKLMGRIRRIIKSDIDEEEIKMIEKAVELDNENLIYKVFLADVIREYTSAIFRKTKNQVDLNTYELEKDIDNLYQKALDLYLYCIEKLPSCIKSLSRCAIGLVKLPKKYSSKYFNIAEEAIIMSLELHPNCPYVHHIAGMIYHKKRTFQDLEKALYHYEKASEFKNFAASLDFLRLKCYLNPDLDPYEDLMKYKTMYKEKYLQIQLKCHLGSYYIFKKRDILTAIQYFNEVLEKDQALLLKI
uniref:Uncharacterized protein n=1 Tax=Clastoptera arizonana TaxID=38151 RepID=A0A1B6DCG4_9HEMI